MAVRTPNVRNRAVRNPAVRNPAVAGMFYPATADECRLLAQQYVTDGKKTSGAVLGNIASSKKLIGGIVPHAGWICSGAVAGETIGAISQSMRQVDEPVDLVVIFGAVHTPIRLSTAALDSHSSWSEPGGECEVIEEVRSALAEKQDLFVVDDRFHRAEHAVEVELPLIQCAWPTAAILPVEVPVTQDAIQVGIATAKRAAQCNGQSNRKVVFLASSDLTHYGPSYRFTPAGIGMAGLEWAKQNDRRLLDRVQKLDVDGVVLEVMQHHNACGAGAIAAMLAACREFGASGATVIRQTSSYQTLHDVAPQPQREPSDNSVGYASVVVG